MTKSKIYIIIASLFVLSALGLAFGPPLRYGTFDDHMASGQKKTIQRGHTLAGYIAFTQPLKNNIKVGDCPYQNFYAKTYAVELWVIAVIFALGSYTHRKKR